MAIGGLLACGSAPIMYRYVKAIYSRNDGVGLRLRYVMREGDGNGFFACARNGHFGGSAKFYDAGQAALVKVYWRAL